MNTKLYCAHLAPEPIALRPTWWRYCRILARRRKHHVCRVGLTWSGKPEETRRWRQIPMLVSRRLRWSFTKHSFLISRPRRACYGCTAPFRTACATCYPLWRRCVWDNWARTVPVRMSSCSRSGPETAPGGCSSFLKTVSNSFQSEWKLCLSAAASPCRPTLYFQRTNVTTNTPKT